MLGQRISPILLAYWMLNPLYQRWVHLSSPLDLGTHLVGSKCNTDISNLFASVVKELGSISAGGGEGEAAAHMFSLIKWSGSGGALGGGEGS